VSNVLKRGAAGQASGEVRMGEFVFHIARGELKRDNETIRLTERERDLLRYFAQRPGMPVPRHELAKSDSGGERAVDVQINRLRRKIENDPANPVYLQTVRGKGYILYAE
jgi:two-component system phosphate regulon response regulator OmpR